MNNQYANQYGNQYSNQYSNQYNIQQPLVKPETEQTKNLKEHFGILAPACLIYACFYALCMYRNGSGITYPFFSQEAFGFTAFV